MAQPAPKAPTAASPMRDFSQSLPMVLMRSREAVMNRFRPVLRRHGVTEQQWRVLRALSELAEIEAGELARRCCILGPSLSRILANLAARGLIERRTREDDQRYALIVLSAEGRALIARVAPHSEARYAEIERAIGHDSLNRLHALLEELSGILESGEQP